MSEKYSIAQVEGGIKISGGAVSGPAVEGWKATEFGPGRVLLEDTTDANDEMKGKAWCSIDVFSDFIFGVHYRRWSGVVSVDTGVGVKRVYFSKGNVVFAASTAMDDRLGEIIYRKGMLSINDLMNCSVQVERGKKFGQVLLLDRIFSNVELWVALKAQVKEIVRSIFMVERVFFEMRTENASAPTRVMYAEGTDVFLNSCYGYGCMYRDFVSRLDMSARVKVNLKPMDSEGVGGGTFVSDILAMIKEHGTIDEVLKASKLLPFNTLNSLMLLVNKGICSIEGMRSGTAKRGRVNLDSLRSKMDVYTLLLSDVQKAFDAANIKLPARDLKMMALDLDADKVSTIYLNDKAELTAGTVDRILSQCETAHSRARYFETRIESLTFFLLQIAGDNLPWEVSKQIKNHYKKVI